MRRGSRVPKKVNRRRKTLLAAAVFLLVAIASFVTPATAATRKILKVTVSPESVPAGATQTFTMTFVNESPRATFGSADVRAPRLISVVSASTPQGTASVVHRTIELRNLGVGPGETLVVTAVAKIPCSAGSGTWAVIARTSPDFSGTDDFTLATGSARHLSVSGDCALQFLNEPADAILNEPITSGDVDPNAPPVKVGILDGNGDTVQGASAEITMSIGTNPGEGTLSGTTTVTANDGVATFSDLSIDVSSNGYTLVASADGFSSATSKPFNIVDAASTCEGSTCSATTTDGTTSATISSHGDGVVEISEEPGALDCPDYTEATADIVFLSTTDARKKIAVAIGPPLAHPKSQGAFRVCYSSPNAFLNRSGELVNLGLLPPCRASPRVPPCVLSAIYSANLVTLTFLAPGGDPKGRL
jgi:methionine-rich copper-binding protein CopC